MKQKIVYGILQPNEVCEFALVKECSFSFTCIGKDINRDTFLSCRLCRDYLIAKGFKIIYNK